MFCKYCSINIYIVMYMEMYNFTLNIVLQDTEMCTVLLYSKGFTGLARHSLGEQTPRIPHS